VDANSRERTLEEALRKARHALIQTVHLVSAVTGRRDRYTSSHQRRTATLALAIGRELGLTAHALEGLYLGALIHDLGKVAIPFEILSKPSRLTAEEYALVKTHVEAGCEILQGVELPWPVEAIVAQHHERLDGSGYPRGLVGDSISLEARIVAVADVFQAMRDRRSYRQALGEDVALSELQRGAGLVFDADAVRALQAVLRAAAAAKEDFWTYLESDKEFTSTVVLPPMAFDTQ
jgi:putative nucleotidyltransferase with HDIG domain